MASGFWQAFLGGIRVAPSFLATLPAAAEILPHRAENQVPVAIVEIKRPAEHTEIHLQGNVIISNKDNATQLHTEQLHYFQERREVTSDVAVLVNRDDDTLRGIGMRGDLDRNRIELLRKVEGNYVQP